MTIQYKEKPTNQAAMENTKHQSLTKHDESFIRLAAAVLQQSEEAILNALIQLREKNEDNSKKRHAA